MDIFDTKLVNPLLAREGGEKFTNNPSDRGGPTRWGITAKKLGEWRKLGRSATAAEVQALQRAEAVDIYRADFWVNPGFNRVATISEKVAEELFDTGVNMGPGTAGKFFQRSLNLCNRRGADYADVGVDGQIGDKSTQAYQALVRKRGIAGAESLIFKCLNGFQFMRYVELAEAGGPNGVQEEFFCGWVSQRIGF
jgi:lysozyme family protein